MAIAEDLTDTERAASGAGSSRTTTTQSRRRTPSAGWTGTTVRVLFGVVFGVDAVLKWLPGYRKTYLSTVKSAAASQPAWLHGWFHFWINLQAKSPMRHRLRTAVRHTPHLRPTRAARTPQPRPDPRREVAGLRVLAEPHTVDRVSGAPLIEPIAVGTHQP